MNIFLEDVAFIKDSIYGKIIYDEVFYYYDCPVLFIAKSSLGKKYLVVSSKMGYNEWEWLMVEIDDAIRDALINNEIYMYNVYKKPLNGEVIRYIYSYKKQKFEIVNPDDLLDEELPEKEVYVK